MSHRLLDQDEYCVYVFDLPDQIKANKSLTRWEKKFSSKDYSEAVSAAKRLYETKQFQKVEVQKKYLNLRKGCPESKIVKIFMSRPKWFRKWLNLT